MIIPLVSRIHSPKLWCRMWNSRYSVLKCADCLAGFLSGLDDLSRFTFFSFFLRLKATVRQVWIHSASIHIAFSNHTDLHIMSHTSSSTSLLYSLWKRKYVGSSNMRLLEVVVKAVLWFINTAAKVSALTTARRGFLLCITELRLGLMFWYHNIKYIIQFMKMNRVQNVSLLKMVALFLSGCWVRFKKISGLFYPGPD